MQEEYRSSLQLPVDRQRTVFGLQLPVDRKYRTALGKKWLSVCICQPNVITYMMFFVSYFFLCTINYEPTTFFPCQLSTVN